MGLRAVSRNGVVQSLHIMSRPLPEVDATVCGREIKRSEKQGVDAGYVGGGMCKFEKERKP